VTNGRVTDEIEYLTADREEKFLVAQANAPIDGRGHFTGEKVSVRYRGDFLEVDPSKVNYMDVSPKQVVSVATALIPFLEHDDANRALMGSNMQRQAVPLLEPESPIVGTGMEERAARDSGQVLVAGRAGVVTSVTAERNASRLRENMVMIEEPCRLLGTVREKECEYREHNSELRMRVGERATIREPAGD